MSVSSLQRTVTSLGRVTVICILEVSSVAETVKVLSCDPRLVMGFIGGKGLDNDSVADGILAPCDLLFLGGRPGPRFSGCPWIFVGVSARARPDVLGFLGTDPAGNPSLRGRPRGFFAGAGLVPVSSGAVAVRGGVMVRWFQCALGRKVGSKEGEWRTVR